MRRRSPFPLVAVVVVAVLFLSVVAFMLFGRGDASGSPEEVIRDFYEFESTGDFGNAWELFHPEMKKKFSKSNYIQTKNHVFMGHMGVEEFDVEIGKLEKVERFAFDDEGIVFKDVRKAQVDMSYDSQFGELIVSQPCYVAIYKGKWKVLWNYHFK
ncbi:hypothetical protein [Rossellomorea marisflavi]|uniref:Nuclear transport factor 2 family protein n=1 Tax=Rossellomorea marisflavi TaxID=189381 RepID=A0A163MDP8_9BACI|nr:hypothetical protein [Rossellomorea marisflavi]KZE52593.1 hypothetical protein AV649_12695 [Rossellomorea marisflavi]